MAVLAAEVQRSEPAPVLDVRVGLALGQKLDGLGEALPGGLVQRGVAVLERERDGGVMSCPLRIGTCGNESLLNEHRSTFVKTATGLEWRSSFFVTIDCVDR